MSCGVCPSLSDLLDIKISGFINVTANGIVSFFFMAGSYSTVEKAMAPHSSTLAWKIPWMEEPGRLQSMRLLRVGHD